jgi:hypothetical protein
VHDAARVPVAIEENMLAGIRVTFGMKSSKRANDALVTVTRIDRWNGGPHPRHLPAVPGLALRRQGGAEAAWSRLAPRRPWRAVDATIRTTQPNFPSWIDADVCAAC